MKIVKQAFQPFMGNQLKAYREKQAISQEAMARRLHISVRSYIDLEHGTNGLSAVTLALFLVLLEPEEQKEILKGLEGMLP